MEKGKLHMVVYNYDDEFFKGAIRIDSDNNKGFYS